MMFSQKFSRIEDLTTFDFGNGMSETQEKDNCRSGGKICENSFKILFGLTKWYLYKSIYLNKGFLNTKMVT